MALSRILAIDYGQTRIGLALSDPLHILSTPFRTLPNTGFENVAKALTQIVAEESVGLVVMGLPLNHEGEDTQQTGIVRKFTEKLRKRLPVPIVWHDERFSTEEARRELQRMGKNPIEGRKIIDQIAATLILREYLETSPQ